jgi:hypothetical protein
MSVSRERRKERAHFKERCKNEKPMKKHESSLRKTESKFFVFEAPEGEQVKN